MSVIQMLPSAEIGDLPVVVKFILQSVGDSDAFEVQCCDLIIGSAVKNDLEDVSKQGKCLF